MWSKERFSNINTTTCSMRGASGGGCGFGCGFFLDAAALALPLCCLVGALARALFLLPAVEPFFDLTAIDVLLFVNGQDEGEAMAQSRASVKSNLLDSGA
jgi:hypothetical protein